MYNILLYNHTILFIHFTSEEHLGESSLGIILKNTPKNIMHIYCAAYNHIFLLEIDIDIDKSGMQDMHIFTLTG